MAQHPARQNETELWFNMPASTVQQQEQGRIRELSAYQATSNRLSNSSIGSTSSQPHHTVPSIFIPPNLDKPLPPSPPGSEKNEHSAAGLRSFFRRQFSNHQDSTHLKPELSPPDQRHSFVEATLSVDTYNHHQNYTRSMPSSPFGYNQRAALPVAATLTRAHSAVTVIPDTGHYRPYSLQPERRPSISSLQQRPASVHTYFDSSPRARTFPETISTSPTARGRSLSHACLSPTEPFVDASQFHLFAEATTGLSDNSDFLSSNSPVRLQGSLFARTISDEPTSIRSSSATRMEHRDITDWENFEPQPYTAQYSQSIQHMNAVNRELEMLGLDDDDMPLDDELPDYAQSQAEANAAKREEALARARELEARWQGSRWQGSRSGAN